MSEVERYWIDPSRLVQEGWHQDDTCVVKDWAYDRVVAERDALQQRLTAADELNDTTKAELAWQESDNAELRKRVDVLDALLREVSASCALSFEDHDATAETLDLQERIDAALKPVEGGSDDA